MLRNHFSRCRTADSFHHRLILQDGSLQVVQLFLYDEFGFFARQRFQSFHYQRPSIFLSFIRRVSCCLEAPTRSHYLFHQQRCGNGFQKVVDSHLHVTLLSFRHRNHIGKPCCFLPFTITGTSTYNLDNLRQRTSDTNRQAHLTPLPVESLFSCSQGNDNVHIFTVFHTLQIALHHIALLLVVLYQVCNLQQSPISRSYIIDTRIIILIFKGSDDLHDFVRLGIFSQSR